MAVVLWITSYGTGAGRLLSRHWGITFMCAYKHLTFCISEQAAGGIPSQPVCLLFASFIYFHYFLLDTFHISLQHSAPNLFWHSTDNRLNLIRIQEKHTPHSGGKNKNWAPFGSTYFKKMISFLGCDWLLSKVLICFPKSVKVNKSLNPFKWIALLAIKQALHSECEIREPGAGNPEMCGWF